jgi:tRNA (adenine22-N1)-methyltransferase
MKKIKLGTRLEQLKKMVNNQYDHVWDCCCDHGLLGMALLQDTQQTTIHFIDVVRSLVDQVKNKLEQFYVDDLEGSLPSTRWQTQCLDVAKIKLIKNQSNLVIIAGIGGEKIIVLLMGIINNNKNMDFELLLCPVHQNYRLREFLIEQGFGLIQEEIVKENNRFYESMHIGKLSEKKLSLVGSEQWNYSRDDDRCYLTKMIQHFERMVNDPKKDVVHILQAYKQLHLELESKSQSEL